MSTLAVLLFPCKLNCIETDLESGRSCSTKGWDRSEVRGELNRKNVVIVGY